jgi:Uma2 family endonuclease
MAEPTTRTKLTYEDFLQIPEDGKRHEIIDGVHYVTASPIVRHQLILGNLYFCIKRYLRENDLGEVFLSPFDVIFSDFDIVEPDLLYLSKERQSLLTEANLQGSPDLVVEILSPSTQGRDRGIKKKLYERSEVSEYWIVDPRGETLEIFRRDEMGGLDQVVELNRAAGDRLLTPLLPDLEIPLQEIFPH